MHNEAVVQTVVQAVVLQLFRQLFCFMVLLRKFLSCRWTENVRSEVIDSTGYVKYDPLLSSLVEKSSSWLASQTQTRVVQNKSYNILFRQAQFWWNDLWKYHETESLPNQFYAALAMFWHQNMGGGAASDWPVGRVDCKSLVQQNNTTVQKPFTWPCYSPVASNSDQHLTFLYNFTTWSNVQDMRTKKVITKDKMSWCVSKFSQLVT